MPDHKEQPLLVEFCRYLHAECRLNSVTISAYYNDLRLFTDFLHDGSLLTVRGEDITKFLHAGRKEGRLYATQIRRLTSIKRFFHFLCHQGLCEYNPASLITVPVCQDRLPSIINQYELETLLDKPSLHTPLGIRDKALLELLAFAGAKISEVLRLTLVSLELSQNCLHIANQRREERNIVILPRLREILEIYLVQARPKLSRHPEETTLFLSRQGNPLTRVSAWRIVTQYAREAKLDKPISPETFRHAFTMGLLANDTDLKIIQQYLGHQNICVTEQYVRKLKRLSAHQE